MHRKSFATRCTCGALLKKIVETVHFFDKIMNILIEQVKQYGQTDNMGKRTTFYGNFYTLFVDQSNDEFLVKNF